ncbi:fungal-specific transcription factor domain-containing protein [Boeremia exigua]|uniref:fungal-specific transcription factor domain-containing protein n=1 Tax=Boeremia exigua TaxID=749465 RepID=UPI001E8E4137|nr:fungal-specific transcription factor domain-containing protein [Boeremia exigua]KAH6620127.1 fungal-specific transcription factor domain-containing protein [Boeremia exigua]
MPSLGQQKALAQDLKTKKTKSRNGCGRCKLKRLKCDETAGSCLQCKKRNVPCPGYEKTLKWSTKYEVFQPTEFTSSPPKATSSGVRKPSKATGSSLPKNVANGIEALVAVLPARRKTADTEMICNDTQVTQPPPLASPPSLEEPFILQESSTEDEDSPRDLEPFPMDDINVLDPTMLDGYADAIPLPTEEFHFDSFDNTDLESTGLEDFGSFDAFDFDPHPTSFKHNESSAELSALTTRESSREASPPRLSRSLLLGFYRLPSPSPNPSSPDDQESLLIQHYFKDVCAVFSAFDSHLNPFRTTIGKIYQDSPSISYAMQSMSAAHLANTFPYMAAIGSELQRKAVAALQEELPLAQAGQISCTRTFLSIMMLGFTTSWHDSNALGTEFLATARGLILRKLMDRSQEAEVQREAQFFEESLIYWEMVMGFVTEDAMSFSRPSGMRPRIVSSQKSTPAGRRPDGKIVPHPWTGVAPIIQALFAEVGRLVRCERSLNKDSVVDIVRRQENLFNATSLEEDLLAVDYPSIDEIADTGDDRTPKEHFTILAEAYRCAGLLELYRVFPSILRKRLGSNKLPVSENVDFRFPMPRFETPYEDADMKLWLNSLAMHILQMIESLPASSGTFCIQQLVITVAACELKFVSTVDFFDVHANDSKVLQAREKVIRRLEVYAHRLPGKPIRHLITLIKETWRQSDEGNDAFWIDIMNEKGWHTII